MTQLKFVNRFNEMKILENSYLKKGSSLFILYGRRRVGKTELVNQFIRDRGIYFLATPEGDKENINDFKNSISRFLNDDAFIGTTFTDWYSFFSILISNTSFQDKSKNSNIIIAIDEFPYLIESNKSIPSIFQKIYDTLIKNSNIMVILLGSSISIMENEVLSYKSPLYGRRSGQLQLKPLKFKYLNKFVDYDIDDLCKTYFVFGGIPEYLKKLNSHIGFWENVLINILSKGAPLYEEADFLLRSEFRVPRNYMLILRSISYGNHTMGDICNYSGMDKSMISKYLDILISLGIVTSEKPFGASEKFKRRLYWISDQYTKFWFRYVLPHKSEIESSHIEEVYNNIKNDFSTFAGEQFENLVKELILEGIMGRPFSNVSRWWGKNINKEKGKNIEEIDIVAYSEIKDELLFAECKWTNKPVNVDLINELKTKSKILREQYPNKKYTYAIFSKSGFNNIMLDSSEDTNFIALSDIEKKLKEI